LEIDRSQHAVSTAQSRLKELDERRRKAAETARTFDREAVELERIAQESAGRLQRLDADLAQAKGSLEECTTSTRNVREKLSAAHRGIAETKEAIFEVMSEAAGLRNRKQEIETAIARQTAHAERLAASLSEAEA